MLKLIVILVLAIGLPEPITSSMRGNRSHVHLENALYKFNGKLFKALIKHDQKRNLFYSPISIHIALGMILLGTNQGSETRAELMKAMTYKADKIEVSTNRAYKKLLEQLKAIKGKASEAEAGNTTRVDMFTRIITDKGVKPKSAYLSHIKESFDSKLSLVSDPESKEAMVKEINEWGKSAGFDSPVVEKNLFDEPFSAILISAINLEAFWLESFSEETGKFHDLGDPDKVRNMTKLFDFDVPGAQYIEFTKPDVGERTCPIEPQVFEKWQARLAHLKFRAIKLKLKDDFNFYMFQPADKTPADVRCREKRAAKSRSGVNNAYMKSFAKLAKGLFKKADVCEGCGSGAYCDQDQTNIEAAIRLLDMEHSSRQIASLSFPKFKFEERLDMIETLKLLGIQKTLSDRAEIGNMTDKTVTITKFTHQSMIEATKFGIRAAGVTIAKAAPVMAKIGSDVHVKHPFLYLINYKKIPLFFGQYVGESSAKMVPPEVDDDGDEWTNK